MCKVVRESSVPDKSNHIDIKYHYIRDMVQRGAVKLQYVAMEEQIADVLTNPLAKGFGSFHVRVEPLCDG